MMGARWTEFPQQPIEDLLGPFDLPTPVAEPEKVGDVIAGLARNGREQREVVAELAEHLEACASLLRRIARSLA